MNKCIRYITLTAIMALSLLSCSRKESGVLLSRGEGLLTLEFGYDLSLSPVTRAESQEDMTFKVEVIDIQSGVTVKTVEDHHTLQNEPIALREGNYIIKASNGTDVDAGFDSPYYEGRDTVAIVAGQEASSMITCTMANVKVTVSFSDAVKQNFSRYSVDVTNGLPNGTLTYDGETLEGQGYFKATGSLVWTITMTNTDGTKYDPITSEITNVKPRDYYNIHFDINGSGSATQEGGVSVRISVDGTVNEQAHDLNVNLNKAPEPVVTEASGADLTDVVRAPQGVGLVGLLNLKAEAGFKRVTITHSSEAVAALGIPGTVDILAPEAGVKETAAAAGLTWSDCAEGETGADIDMRQLLSSHLAIGTYEFAVNILDMQSQYVSTKITVKVVPNVEVSTISTNPWAKFVYVYAQYNTESEPEGMGFELRKAGESTWTPFSGELTREGTAYSAKIGGLEPSTQYEVRAITAAEHSDDNIMPFTTETAEQLPNFNFDSWSDSGHSPNADGDSFWDSGNGGTSIMSEYPTSQETSFVKSGSAVRMESKYVTFAFAGGNIYSGSFGKVQLPSGATINFGRQYTCRPTALHGWYSYAPKEINRTKAPYDNLKGTMDVAKIYVALTDWSAPFVVNTNTGTFFDVNDPSVIAYGELEDGTGTNGEYREFTINLEYRDLERIPTHVLVVATASKYADYFTGGEGSLMYIDEFEFLFE